MVEGKKSKANVQFVKLNKEELSEKIALLVSTKSRVIFWKSSPYYYEGKAFHLKKQDAIILTLENTISLKKFNDESIKVYCVIDDVDYFFKAKVVQHNDDEKIISFKIGDECFRLEKRLRERALLFPKHEAYFYVRYKIDAPVNVVSFNRNEIIKKPTNELMEISKKRLIQENGFEELEESEDIVGLRIEDITSSGISLIVNEKEREKLFNKVSSLISGMISINRNSFNIKDASIAYTVDYIHPQLQNSQMIKVGLSFQHSPTLKRAIEENFNVDQSINDHLSEFEEYLGHE